jgi:hypothetical protein
MSQIDQLLPFQIGPVNGREAQESGLRLKASVVPTADVYRRRVVYADWTIPRRFIFPGVWPLRVVWAGAP